MNSRTLLLLILLPVLALAPDRTAAGQAGGHPGEDLAAALSAIGPHLVPSGILYDRVLPLSGLMAHDGHGEAPPVSPAQWRQMLHELSRAASTGPAWPSVAAMRAEVRAARAAGRASLAVLDTAYDRLRPDALDRGLLTWRDGRLVPAPDAATVDVTIPGRVFAAAALAGRTHRGSDVQFLIERRHYLAGSTDFPVRLQLDAGDGLGFRALEFGEPLHTVYRTPGRKTLRLKATYADGDVRESAFRFDVIALETPAPDETWPITAAIAYQDTAGQGQAYLYLAPGRTQLVDPVVVVEGFDLDDSMGWEELYALLNQENLLEELRQDGFDAVVLDFASATAPLQRNAFVLVELLQQVQAAIAPGQDLAVVGASMGGLIARYALAYMEGGALEHRARTMISFDAPHGGANIPLGLQYWVQFFAPESTEAAYLLSRLDTPAARQMLLYHHTDPPGTTGESDPLRAAFLADLAALGDWPADPRLVAVANGSGSGLDQGYAAGAQLIHYEYDSFLVDIRGNVWAVPDQSSLRIFQGLIDQLWPLPDRQLNVTVSGTRPWDSAPGGYRASMAQMDTTAVPYGDIVALHPNHAFIPTVSALALATDDPFFDVAGAPDLLALTALDAVYYPQENQEHVLITPENKAWLRGEIERAPTSVAQGPPPPAAASLWPASPNPFNPSTSIDFNLASPGRVLLAIHDARGRRVATLVADRLSAGRHRATWNGDDDHDRPVSAGVYFCVLQAGERTLTKKLALVR